MRALLGAISGVGLMFYPGAATNAPPAPQLSPNSERMAPMVLNGYSRFPRNIATAPIYDLEVQKLDADLAGKPTALEIWLPTGHTLTVVASNISYDQQRNILIVGLTDAQLGTPRLPRATP